ncbi:unnamed protein product [Schistocephalus solidus]|uniref:Metalloendopeptidase n=1 Tax=Schistocephalus solidus TaxID=70667 RepID=A0A3P7D2J2_SCHSO|nr:unnamed protein product [Schistocephalus solidus]
MLSDKAKYSANILKNYSTLLPHKHRCCARVGRQGDNQQQSISIAPKCENLGSVVHELGHVIGFWHEHSRPDRDAFVEIFTKNIETKNLFNFEQKSYNEVNSLGEPYDYDSIMHYRTNAFAKTDGLETMRPKHGSRRIGITSKPSKGDTKQVNMLYKCPCKSHFVCKIII